MQRRGQTFARKARWSREISAEGENLPASSFSRTTSPNKSACRLPVQAQKMEAIGQLTGGLGWRLQQSAHSSSSAAWALGPLPDDAELNEFVEPACNPRAVACS